VYKANENNTNFFKDLINIQNQLCVDLNNYKWENISEIIDQLTKNNMGVLIPKNSIKSS